MAPSDEKQAPLVFQAIQKGMQTDAESAALARSLVDAAYAGENAAGQYKDDKTSACEKTVAWVKDHATRPETWEILALLEGSWNSTAFTDTNVALTKATLEAIMHDVSPNPRNLAGLGAAYVRGAVSATQSDGTWADDKTAVGRDVLKALPPPATQTARDAISLVEKIVDGTHYTPSVEHALLGLLDGLAEGRCDSVRAWRTWPGRVLRAAPSAKRRTIARQPPGWSSQALPKAKPMRTKRSPCAPLRL